MLQRTRAFIRRHPRLTITAVFLGAWTVASLVFFWRSPNNLINPNFYAEDGMIFTPTVLDKGPVQALGALFNGYFVVGLYMLADLAILINRLWHGGEFVHIPAAIAVVSYVFLGFCAALPILTLGKILRPVFIGLAVLALMFIPMPNNDYIVIGTLGNLKFAFGFIAMLLIAKRWTLKRTSRLIPILDLGVLLCAYTTATVYPLLLFYFFCDGLQPKQLVMQWRSTWRLSNLSLWSAAGLAVVAALQLVFVATHGVTKMPGYLDAPFQMAKAIEIFAGRSVLFTFILRGYRFLNDPLTIVGCLALLSAIWFFARRRILWLCLLGLYASVTATVLFTVNRPGLSELFENYDRLAPDQFFYAQGMMVTIVAFALLQAVVGRVKYRHAEAWAALPVIVLIAMTVPAASTYGANNSMESGRGTIYTDAKITCAEEHGSPVSVDIYPVPPWEIIRPRDQVCTPGLQALPDSRPVDLGLKVEVNNPINVTDGSLTQRFSLPGTSRLQGLKVFFSTYQLWNRSNYQLVMYKPDCRTVIRTAGFSGRGLSDNDYAVIKFAPVDGNDFCWGIKPGPGAQDLAVQISSTNSQAVKPAEFNGQAVAGPVAFQPILLKP